MEDREREELLVRKVLLIEPENNQVQSLGRVSPNANGLRVFGAGGAGLSSVLDLATSGRTYVNGDRHRQWGWGHPCYPSGKQSVQCFAFCRPPPTGGKGRD